MLLMLLMPLIALSVVIFCFLIADCTIILFQWSLQCVHSSLQSEVLLKVPLNEVP